MIVRNRGLLVAGFGAVFGLCAASGCQTASMRHDPYVAHSPTAAPARPWFAWFRRPAPTTNVAVVAQTPAAPAAVPAAGAPSGAAASEWHTVQRVRVEPQVPPPVNVVIPPAPPPNCSAPSPAASAPPPVSVVIPPAPPPAPPGVIRADGDPTQDQPVIIASTAPDVPPELAPPPKDLPDAPHLEPQPAVVLDGPVPHPAGPPREFAKRPLPPYIVEPPDVLLIQAGKDLTSGKQDVDGPHLVRPDGTVSLGIYGSVYVAGLTLEEIRNAVVAQLHETFDKEPIEKIRKVVVVDVLAYNSKVYYVITDGGGYGAQIYTIPATGNETVLDALAKVNGLPPVASKKKVWLARPVPSDPGHAMTLPVDYCAVVAQGSPATNYQVFPGDRIYVGSDGLINLDSRLSKILAPIDRVFGSVLLGSSTVNSIRNRTTSGSGGVP